MNLPLVSIIIPVYNVEDYLRECLDSVCNQTYKNLEIICIDDGSTDNSLAILKEYAQKDSRIILLSQPNAGQAAARNSGLKIATGEWIGGLDSDDYLELDAIEKIMKHANESVDVIHFCSRYYDITGTSKEPKLNVQETGFIPVTESYIVKLHPGFWDKLWRKKLLDRCNIYFPLGLHFEDLAFTRCCLSMASAMYCMQDKLYIYRYRPGSTMEKHRKRKGGRKILDYIQVADFCLNFWQKNNIRLKFGYTTPSFLEMEIVRNIKDCFSWWAADEYLHEAWLGIRMLIDKYGLGSRLTDFPDLALYYYLPPYVYDTLRKKVIDSNLKKHMYLFANERYIYWTYRRMQLLSLLTWGKKKRKYKEKKKKYHDLVRLCRQLKRQARGLLHI